LEVEVHLRLLTDIKDVRGEESDKMGNGASTNDDLGVVGCTGCDVCESADIFNANKVGHTGQSPCGLELEDGVVAGQELDESRNDTTLDNTINRRVLFFRQQSDHQPSSLGQEEMTHFLNFMVASN
jgi:hypothetical protein